VENVTVVEAAVNDVDGMANFDAGARGELAHISSDGALQVRAVTLDGLFARGEIPAPHCIKMDIEGAEYRALLGARSLLAAAHPVLFLATHGRDVQAQCRKLLEELGYRLAPIGAADMETAREFEADFRGRSQ
jgi:hypothetical protein